MNIRELLEATRIRKISNKYYVFELDDHSDITMNKIDLIEYGTYLASLAAEILEAAQDVEE